ncbi:hypothetical protein Tco_1038615 [Tanacetum coccineum]
MSGQLAELNNTVKIQQTTISELKECLRKNDSENEHLKSKVVDFTTVQNLRVQVTELKSVNESLNLTVEELSNARALAEVTLREKDELIFDQCKKMRLLEEQCEPFYEVPSEFDSEIVHDTQDNSEKDLILSLQTQGKETVELVLHFSDEKYCALTETESLKVEIKMSSLVQKEYNDLLASNDVLKQRLETKFKFLKHDNSVEKMIEMIEKEYESNVLKISITSSTFESKNLELVKKMRDKVKCFDEEKKAFETKIAKLEKVLAQRVKYFNDVKTELSKRTYKFETYFANLEKENALLKSQLASQNYTSLQKENNDLKMHYKSLFDSIKQKKVVS